MTPIHTNRATTMPLTSSILATLERFSSTTMTSG